MACCNRLIVVFSNLMLKCDIIRVRHFCSHEQNCPHPRGSWRPYGARWLITWNSIGTETRPRWSNISLRPMMVVIRDNTNEDEVPIVSMVINKITFSKFEHHLNRSGREIHFHCRIEEIEWTEEMFYFFSHMTRDSICNVFMNWSWTIRCNNRKQVLF